MVVILLSDRGDEVNDVLHLHFMIVGDYVALVFCCFNLVCMIIEFMVKLFR